METGKVVGLTATAISYSNEAVVAPSLVDFVRGSNAASTAMRWVCNNMAYPSLVIALEDYPFETIPYPATIPGTNTSAAHSSTVAAAPKGDRK